MDNFTCQNVNKYFHKHYFLGCKKYVAFLLHFLKGDKGGGCLINKVG